MRMWRKGNPYVLLVEMQTGAASVESSMEIPEKIKNGSAFWPNDPLLGIYPNNTSISKTLVWQNISTPIFIAALFTIAKIWKQPKCPSVDEWVKQVWDIYTLEFYLTIKKKENFTPCNSMDGPGEHYASWNKPVKERQIPYDFTRMWNLMNTLNGQAK